MERFNHMFTDFQFNGRCFIRGTVFISTPVVFKFRDAVPLRKLRGKLFMMKEFARLRKNKFLKPIVFVF